MRRRRPADWPRQHRATAMRIIAAALVLSGALRSGRAAALTPLQQRGEALAVRLCGHCHAVGRSDQSATAGAPALRSLSRRVDIDGLAAQLRQGLMSGHPDMPTFRFTRQDAHAFVAYLRHIEAP